MVKYHTTASVLVTICARSKLTLNERNKTVEDILGTKTNVKNETREFHSYITNVYFGFKMTNIGVRVSSEGYSKSTFV